MAAENIRTGQRNAVGKWCFNEAAAHGRGKPSACLLEEVRRSGFNEAAAHGRGKHLRRSPARAAAAGASMRPRRMAAENAGLVEACAARLRRFNEAAAHGRGKLGTAVALRHVVFGLQ